MPVTCKFPADTLDDTIRDRFVGGFKSEPMQRRLLSEREPNLKTAVDIALALESAEKSTKSLRGAEDPTIKAVVRDDIMGSR